MRIGIFFFIVLNFVWTGICFSDESISDQYPGSPLYSKPVEVVPNVWSAIGATAAPTYENSGHNNNLSFILTSEGVVVINSGAAYILAEALHREIKQITNQPVKLIINENGQGHAMLGNTYWHEQGVKILAHKDADIEFRKNGYQILERMKRYNKDKAAQTAITPPTHTFTEKVSLYMGETKIEVLYLGAAHSPGDISVWLPDKSTVIAGDMAFHERLLPIFPETDTAAWVNTWDQGFETLNATYVIPGHGHPTNMDQVRKYTRDYLLFLRKKIKIHLENGGGLETAYYVNQSPYSKLDTFEELAKINAGRVYEEMEFELD